MEKEESCHDGEEEEEEKCNSIKISFDPFSLDQYRRNIGQLEELKDLLDTNKSLFTNSLDSVDSISEYSRKQL